MATMFKYSKAICTKIPKSLVTQALRMSNSHTPIDYVKACSEHDKYVETLKSLGIDVILLDEDESFPDCVFVEDPAVVVKDQALITNPGHSNRKGETQLIKETLESLGIKVNVMKEPAEMDGGDVLFTGKEFFVGISSRTNEKSLEVLKETFTEYPVHGIHVLDETLHLKSMMSMAGDNIIAVGQSVSASNALNEIQNKSNYEYEIIRVADDAGANCLWVNGHLIHRSSKEFPGIDAYYSTLKCPKLELSNSELCKVDGALTCCSLLIN